MKIEFGNIWMLLLYPIIVFLIIYLSRNNYSNRFKKYLTIIIRCIFMLCLVLALADVSVVMTSKDTTTIFLSDVSSSVAGNKEEMKDFIRGALRNKGKEDLVGSVVFGKDAELDVGLTTDFTSNVLESGVNPSYTDMEQGLLKSIALIPRDTNKRIVILTDGIENKGEASKLIHSINQQGIEIKVKIFDTHITNEVYVDNFYIPQKVNQGEQFQVHMDIFSTIDTKAKVTLIADGEIMTTDQVQLRKGSNNYVMNDIAKKMGFVSYDLLVEPMDDTLTVNNTYSAFTLVESSPKVLIVYDDRDDAIQIEKIVESIGLKYDSVSSGQVPTAIENMLKYKSMILCNVSADRLQDAFLNNLEYYVKEFGGGFITIGGENAYALGGYYKTPLEKVLPVNMNMRGLREKPTMAMMLVIDKSGSMSGMKLRLAKEAALRTVEVLEDKDEIGVVAFDSVPYNVVDLQKAENRESINESIVTINEGGGTSILPALEDAYDKLSKSNAEIKHIILLTDGQAEQSGYEVLISQMKELKITLSTVGVGDGADTKLLAYLAASGNGRYYLTKDGTSIPRIFAKEAFMATRTYLNNITFTPEISAYHSILSDIYDEGLPQLYGYVGTSPKDAATVLLTSPINDPILAVWQYGLGKTAAWCSDLSGEWSALYNSWSKNNVLWHNIINYTIENYSKEPIEIESTYENGEVKITLNASNNTNTLLDVAVQIVSPTNKMRTTQLEPIRKGVYEGTFLPDEIGSYMIKGIQKNEGEIIGTGLSGITIPYSEEYKITQDRNFNSFIKKVGGQYIETSDEVFGDIEDKVKRSSNITNGLLIIALIIWLIDIAVRRLNVISQLQKLISPVHQVFYRIHHKISTSHKVNNQQSVIPQKEVAIESTTNKQQSQEVVDQRKHSKVTKKENSKQISKSKTNKEENRLNTGHLLDSLKKKG